MLHVISALCAARDLHTIAPGPLERVRDGSRRSKDIVKYLDLRLSGVIIVIIIIITIIIIIIIIIVIIIIFIIIVVIIII